MVLRKALSCGPGPEHIPSKTEQSVFAPEIAIPDNATMAKLVATLQEICLQPAPGQRRLLYRGLIGATLSLKSMALASGRQADLTF